MSLIFNLFIHIKKLMIVVFYHERQNKSLSKSFVFGQIACTVQIINSIYLFKSM